MIGYYEWTGEKGRKQPHFIHSDDELAAAGLTWTAEIAGERRRVFVVVTREARDASGEVDDRMPAFLTLDLWDDCDDHDEPRPSFALGRSLAERRDSTVGGAGDVVTST